MRLYDEQDGFFCLQIDCLQHPLPTLFLPTICLRIKIIAYSSITYALF